MPYSDAYNRLVKDDGDIEGQVAYGIYKKAKCEFIRRKQAELGAVTIPEDVIEEFYANQTDFTLELYRKHAKDMTRAFLDELYKEETVKSRSRRTSTKNSPTPSSPLSGTESSRA